MRASQLARKAGIRINLKSDRVGGWPGARPKKSPGSKRCRKDEPDGARDRKGPAEGCAEQASNEHARGDNRHGARECARNPTLPPTAIAGRDEITDDGCG